MPLYPLGFSHQQLWYVLRDATWGGYLSSLLWCHYRRLFWLRAGNPFQVMLCPEATLRVYMHPHPHSLRRPDCTLSQLQILISWPVGDPVDSDYSKDGLAVTDGLIPQGLAAHTKLWPFSPTLPVPVMFTRVCNVNTQNHCQMLFQLGYHLLTLGLWIFLGKSTFGHPTCMIPHKKLFTWHYDTCRHDIMTPIPNDTQVTKIPSVQMLPWKLFNGARTS